MIKHPNRKKKTVDETPPKRVGKKPKKYREMDEEAEYRPFVGRGARIAEPTPKKAPVDTFVMPKTVAGAGDMLYRLREQRLAIEAQAEEVGKKEARIKEYIINNLPKQEATGARGKVAQVKIEKKDVPTAKDWAKIQAFIKKYDAFDLVQRRLNDTAVKARWAEGKKVPGVEKFSVVTVSCTKLGEK